MLWMGFFCLLFTILALRTNIVFFLILGLLVPAFGLLAGAFWVTAEGDSAKAATLQKAAGGFCFVICLLGWYIQAAIMLAAVDFPLVLPGKSSCLLLFAMRITDMRQPVGDLSTMIKGASDRAKAKEDRYNA